MPETALGGGGAFGGDLKKCLRDMQHVQPRFESLATPRRRYVCLLRPLALELAIKAGDARLETKIQKRAEHALKSMMEAKDVFAAGLAGDYGEVCVEFLRCFDVHDHDPATAARQVQDFTKKLRLLFVDEHIVRVPAGASSASTPGSASTSAAPGSASTSAAPEPEPQSKTLTQIALAAVKEPFVVSYGCKTWTLWNRPFHWSHCKGAMRSMQHVAQDAIDRLSAEFDTGDLYLAYRLFDLALWGELGRLPPEDARAEELWSMLKDSGRKLCGALGAVFDERAWTKAAVTAMKLQAEMLRRSEDKSCVDNRLAWRALIDSGDTDEPVTSVVLFYFSTWDGTGAVERGLGKDSKIQKQHVGDAADASCFDADVYSFLLELNQEGPQREEDMFTEASGALLFTDFSRACAEHWVRTHGRRFACYKTRKDKDRKVSKYKRKRQYTDKAVQARARSAYARLCETAIDGAADSCFDAEPTVVGVGRRELVASLARMPDPEVGEKTLRFRADTVKKRTAKAATDCWSGRASGPLTRNLGGALAVEAKKTSVAMAERARRWQLGKARRARAAARKPKAKASPKAKAKAKAILVVSSAGARASTPGAPKPAASSSTGRATASASARPASSSTASASTHGPVLFKFGTCLQTLVKKRQPPDTAETLNWLTAVAHGGRVEVDGKCVTLTPGIRKAQRLDITNGFMLNHTRLYESLRSSMRAYGSKWKQRKDGDPGVRIGGRIDLIAFLLTVQRAAEC